MRSQVLHEYRRTASALALVPTPTPASQFVIRYRTASKSGNRDANDAAAICEATGRPQMRSVPRRPPRKRLDAGMRRTSHNTSAREGLNKVKARRPSTCRSGMPQRSRWRGRVHDAALRQCPELAGCHPPPRSPVRRLSNALRAVNIQRPSAPYESGMKGRQVWPLSAATDGSKVSERLPLMMWFDRSTTSKLSRLRPFHPHARRGATKRHAPPRGMPRSAQTCHQQAQAVDRPETLMDAGSCARNSPSTSESA